MIQDHIIAATEKYKQTLNAFKIKKEIRIKNHFDFRQIDDEKMAEVLKD